MDLTSGGGIEAIIHSVRRVLQDGDDSLGVLQVDLVNAYNQASRNVAFREVEQHFPDCIKWVLTSYATEAKLVIGPHIILSQAGLHQGDPIAGLLFSLVLQPIIDRIQREVPNLELYAWYLDDGTQVGNKEDFQRVVDIIRAEGPARGLHLSSAATVRPPTHPKSTVWFPRQTAGDDPLVRGIPNIKENGIVLLGTPVGDQAFTKDKIRGRFRKIQQITGRRKLTQLAGETGQGFSGARELL